MWAHLGEITILVVRWRPFQQTSRPHCLPPSLTNSNHMCLLIILREAFLPWWCWGTWCPCFGCFLVGNLSNIWSQCMYFHQWCSPHRCERPATFEECHLNRILWWSSAAAQAAPTPHSHPLIGLAALIQEQVDDHDHPDHDHDHRVTDDWIQDVSVPFLWWQIS